MRVCGLPQEGIPRRKNGAYAHGMNEEMTYAQLGRSGLLVSRIGLGTAEMEPIPALRSLGIGLIPYSPLHAGLLAGVLEAVAEGGISDESTLQRIEAHRDQLEATKGCAGTWVRNRLT